MIYLGTIDNAGSDVKNNLNTSTPFTIPHGRIVVQPSAATYAVAKSAAQDAAFLPGAVTSMLQLGAANSIQDLGKMDGGCTLAARKTDAGVGTLKVFLLEN